MPNFFAEKLGFCKRKEKESYVKMSHHDKKS